VLDHDGVVRMGVRKRSIADVERRALPSHIPTLAELYDTCGHGYELSLDVKDAAAAQRVVDVAREAGGSEALGRLWLCHPDWHQVAQWRALGDDVRLVDSTRLRKIKEGTEVRAAALADAGIDAINMHHTDWTMGLATLFHRFELHCFGWDAQLDRILAELLGFGLDAVYSDHVDRMMEAVKHASR
jgi:glycerophosphoryl diester phosphodiesterase